MKTKRKIINKARYWSEFLPTLREKAVDEALGSVFFRNEPLNKWLRKSLSGGRGQDVRIVGDPVFEPMFGWKSSGKSMKSLCEEGLVRPRTVQALGERASELSLYTHQYKSVLSLLDKKRTRSLIISSGTGSGKTECFMYPMLEDLVSELEDAHPYRSGLRALFLYPLNALIESQKERLDSFTKPLDGQLKYVLYNGPLPEQAKTPDKAQPEIIDRTNMRKTPPQIMVSNPSMIERMLLRKKDVPIINATKRAKSFRWVVIDEAHTYTGSRAAELSLLIRRFLNRIDCDPRDVHFVCTSATMDMSQKEQIRKFLCDLAGADPANVDLIVGERKLPKPADLAALSAADAPSLDELSALPNGEGLMNALKRSPVAMYIRNHFITKGAVSLSKLRTLIHADGWGDLSEGEVLRLIDLLSRPLDSHFLPLRLHLPLNTMGRIMACPDPNCRFKDEELKDPQWKFGQCCLDERKTCDCGAPLFPIAACSECNAVYLKAAMKNDDPEEFGPVLVAPDGLSRDMALWDNLERSGVTEVSASADADSAAQEEELDAEVEPDEELVRDYSVDGEKLQKESDSEPSLEVDSSAPAELSEDAPAEDAGDEAVAERQYEPPTPVLITQDQGDVQSGVIKWKDDDGEMHRLEDVRFVTAESNANDDRPAEGNRIECPSCLAPLQLSKYYIRSISDKYVRALLPFVLEYCSGESDQMRPMDGNRLLTFTDSRPQTAENSALIEREGQRSYTVTHLLRRIAGELTEKDKQELETQQNLIRKLEPLAATGDACFQGLIDDARKKIAALTERHISWTDLKDIIRNDIPIGERETEVASQLIRSVWMRFSFDERKEDVAERPGIIAEVLMLREFGFRPRNGVSLETCGLIRIDYSGLAAVKSAPAAWLARKYTLEDWKSFLKLFMDFEVRGNYCYRVPKSWKSIGGDRRIKPKVLLHYSATDAAPTERAWPQVYLKLLKRGSHKPRRIVRYLAALLNIELNASTTDEDADLVNTLLQQAFTALRDSGVLPKAEDLSRGFRLECEKQIVFVRNDTAWRFEKSKQLFDTIIGNPETAPCPQDPHLRGAVKVELPKPFEGGDLREGNRDEYRKAVREALETQNAYRKLIDAGNWNRIGTYALEEIGYFSSAEHSAQIENESRKLSTERFKKGIINVLCSSTTMEMGVDIGGVNTVLMNGIPPHASNYLQRAGRAGRSGETRANVFTVCRNTSRDRQVFVNPVWPLEAPQPVLSVSLESKIIVQRHVNAQFFTDFILENDLESEEIHLSDWLSDRQKPFTDWLARLSEQGDTARRVRRITKGTILGSASIQELANTARVELADVIREWNQTVQRYVQRMRQLQPGTAAHNALKFQRDHFLSKDVYDKLVADLWLPSSIRVTNVVEFDNLSEVELHKLVSEQLAREAEQSESQTGRRKKGSVRGAEFQVRKDLKTPTRENRVGIFEYAPGATLIIDHNVYTSSGLILNSQRPDEKNAGSIEERRRILKCPHCGQITLSTIAEGNVCPFCGASFSFDSSAVEDVIIPKGFSVHATHQPTKNYNDKVRYPRESSVVSIDEPWENVGADDTVQFRTSERGSLITCNHGPGRAGFDVCLACGWARPHNPDAEVKHYPHRSISPMHLDKDGYCNSYEAGRSYLIQPGMFIAAESRTDCFSLSIKIDPSFRQKWEGDDYRNHVRSAGVSVSVMLRRSIARYFSIEEEEIGFTPPQIVDNRVIMSFYDTQNGGYCSRVANRLGEFLRDTRERLASCPSGCHDACINCVLTFDTGRLSYKVSRFDGVRLLSDSLMNSLTIPDRIKSAFGEDVRLQTGTFDDAVIFMAEMQTNPRVRFFVEKPADDAVLGGSDLLHLVRRLKFTLPGAGVELVAKDFSWKDLSSEQQTRLSGLAELGTEFRRIDGLKLPASCELTSDTHSPILLASVRFDDSDGTADPDGWNWSDEGLSVIAGSASVPKDRPDDAPVYEAPIVLPPPADSTVISDFRPEKMLTTVNFGDQFFTACAKAMEFESLDKWIEGRKANPDTRIEEVVYNDRYLEHVCEPVIVLSLFKAVARTGKLAEGCRMTIRTTDPDTRKFRSNLPRKLNHVWGNEDIRHDVFSVLQANLKTKDDVLKGVPIELRCEPKESTFHDRRLSIKLTDGRTLWFMIGRGISIFELKNTNFEGIWNPDETDIGRYLFSLLQPSTYTRRTELLFKPDEAVISVWTKTGED